MKIFRRAPQPDLTLVLIDKNNFKIEKADSKKKLSVKSFNNKIHKLFNHVDPTIIFNALINSRIFFRDDPRNILVIGKLTKKIAEFIPSVCEKLFGMGVVDKITWRGVEFYYLNDTGLDLCCRNFKRNAAQTGGGDYFTELADALQFAAMFLSEPRLKGSSRVSFPYGHDLPFARAIFIDDENKLSAVLMISLILLGESWVYTLATLRLLIEREVESNINLTSVIFFATSKTDLAWLKIFDTVKLRKVNFLLFTWDGLWDRDGEEIQINSLRELSRKKVQPTDTIEIVDEEITPAADSFETIAADADFETVPAETETVEDTIPDAEEITFDVEEKTDGDLESAAEPDENIFTKLDYFSAEKIETPAPVENFDLGDTTETSPEDLVIADFLRSATSLFKDGESGRAMLSLYALKNHFAGSDEEIQLSELAREIGFILDDPLTMRTIHNFDVFNFWTGVTEIPKLNIGTDYLNLAATIKIFYAPASPTSYQIKQLWKQLNDDKSNSALKACPAAKKLINLFSTFMENTHRAFANCLTNSGSNGEDTLEAALEQIKNAEAIAENALRHEVNHRRIRDVLQQLFKYNGYVRKYLDVENYSDEEILTFCERFESGSLRELIYSDSATIDEGIFDEEKIDEFIDEIWDNPSVQLSRRKHEKFINKTNKNITRDIRKILTALANYLYIKSKTSTYHYIEKQSAPVDKALEILDELKRQLAETERRVNLGQVIFRIFVDNLVKRLNGENTALTYRDCLLGANYIELEDDLPSTDSFGIEEFSLKSRAEAFEADLSGRTFEENLQRAYDTAIQNYDFGVLQYLMKYFPSPAKTVNETAFDRNVDKQITRAYDNFSKDLELARTYARITDHEKIDDYINAVIDAREHFVETRNAGLFQRFIDACNASINKDSEIQSRALNERLNTLKERLEKDLGEGETLETRFPIIADVHHQIELKNFTVAEDYMNRIEKEGGNLLTNLDLVDSNLDTLNEFINEHESLYNAISRERGSLDKANAKFNSSRHLNRKVEDSLDFVRGWQSINSGDNKSIEISINVILSHLGYGGGKITGQGANTTTQKSYTVSFSEPIRRNSYPHPFAIFGTEIYSKGLEVIYLNARSAHTPESIAQILAGMAVDRGTICLVNFALTLPERRKIAYLIKLDPNLKNILVVDQVMALYLARFDDTNRGKKMLQIALPFARVQPYTSKGSVAPEMFIGRSEELDKIRSMTGPVFVYGGRQLGKSALLRQVKSIEHNPSQLCYAFFIDLKDHDSERALKRIVQELQAAKLIGDEVENWSDFSFEMHRLLGGQLRGVFKPKKLLLLLDESDAFLSDENTEGAINVFRQLMVEFSGQFKFVLAGLHKVIRFEKNSSFTNLNHISVLPFRISDAMELFIKPMSYLGFHVVDESLISAILSQTNYYPGLIQHYCQMLVEAVKDLYKNRHFDATKNPPYPLNDDYLKNMLGNSDFQKEIKQRFQDTLAVVDDNYYEILALAVAWICYDHDDRPVSADVTEIRETCGMCGIRKIMDLSDAELVSLLDEMVELNLFRRVDDKFEFNRYSFRHMLGTAAEVEEKLIAYGLNQD